MSQDSTWENNESEDNSNTENQSQTVTVTIGQESTEVDAPIEAGKLEEMTEARNIKKYTVKDYETGEELTPADFPYSENLKISTYNENA